MKPFVSVVTPVYNGERHLKACIESVLAQTWGDFEYVILDNASTDGTADIVHHYAGLDRRIVVHRNDTLLPAIRNHNRSLSLISSATTYCKPLMADDWLFPECLERTILVARAHRSVGLVCTMAIDGTRAIFDRFPYPGKFVDGKRAVRLALQGFAAGDYFFGSSTTMLFRADLVRSRNAFYDESNLHADLKAAMEVVTHSDFSYLHEVLAFVRMHEDSITASVAVKYDTIVANYAELTEQYGPRSMAKEEYRHTLKRVMGTYYRTLARALLLLRERKYWDIQKESFGKLQGRFSLLLFGRAVILEALSMLTQPRITRDLIKSRLQILRGR